MIAAKDKEEGTNQSASQCNQGADTIENNTINQK